jgi:hypothetical protein
MKAKGLMLSTAVLSAVGLLPFYRASDAILPTEPSCSR